MKSHERFSFRTTTVRAAFDEAILSTGTDSADITNTKHFLGTGGPGPNITTSNFG